MAQKQPDITIYYLQSTRAIRPVWLLEELGVPYKLEVAPYKQEPEARRAFNAKSGSPMGKYPSIRDGDLIVHESGAIIEYLCDNYDLEHRLIPKDPALRARTQIFVHAAEGTLALHAIALFRFHSSIQTITHSSPEAVAAAETSMAASIQEDLDWLESELAASTGSFLVGGTPTAADVMTMFSVQILYKFKMGIDGSKSWPKVEAWLKACEGTASYKRAVERSGFVL